jgi:hypothetical protein
MTKIFGWQRLFQNQPNKYPFLFFNLADGFTQTITRVQTTPPVHLYIPNQSNIIGCTPYDYRAKQKATRYIYTV